MKRIPITVAMHLETECPDEYADDPDHVRFVVEEKRDRGDPR